MSLSMLLQDPVRWTASPSALGVRLLRRKKLLVKWCPAKTRNLEQGARVQWPLWEAADANRLSKYILRDIKICEGCPSRNDWRNGADENQAKVSRYRRTANAYALLPAKVEVGC